MASAVELAYINAVALAEGVRQQSKAAARVTYGFDPANLAAYKIAVADADVAYVTAVNTAANTADLQLGLLGLQGPIPTTWAPLLTMA